ncbi:MAG: pseudoazurin [Cardiobacteriaceae bacterium]|nr:pseudoazurin [Cardiobacteriaceae bacterium]
MKKFLLLNFMISQALWAAEYEVKMLDIGSDKEPMVFEPAFLHVNVGDTVTFIPTNKGHNVESKVMPEGAEKFQSALDEKFSITLTQEGVYIYVCPPHSMMNMVGMIQVGKAVNLADVLEKVPRLEKRAMSNKGRLEKLAEQIKEE